MHSQMRDGAAIRQLTVTKIGPLTVCSENRDRLLLTANVCGSTTGFRLARVSWPRYAASRANENPRSRLASTPNAMPLVLTWRTGLSRKLNTCVERLPICSRITTTAAALSGYRNCLARLGLVRMNPCGAPREIQTDSLSLDGALLRVGPAGKSSKG